MPLAYHNGHENEKNCKVGDLVMTVVGQQIKKGMVKVERQ
jgi:hypothetical protein